MKQNELNEKNELMLMNLIENNKFFEFKKMFNQYEIFHDLSFLIQHAVYYDITFFDFLYDNKKIDKTFNNNYALRMASRSGKIDIVKKLLKLKEVYPASLESQALIEASSEGHIEIVKLLLKEKTINPNDRNCCSILLAEQNKHYDIVKLLWKEKSVQLYLKNNNDNLYQTLLKKYYINNLNNF